MTKKKIKYWIVKIFIPVFSFRISIRGVYISGKYVDDEGFVCSWSLSTDGLETSHPFF